MTKRISLSKMAQIFDPLGPMSPIIIVAKLIIQRLWQLQVNWNEPVSDELCR